jgi:D-alanyl-D-alanine carboxypeptidase
MLVMKMNKKSQNFLAEEIKAFLGNEKKRGKREDFYSPFLL